MSEPTPEPTEAETEAVLDTDDTEADDTTEADELVLEEAIEPEPYPGDGGPQDEPGEVGSDGGADSEPSSS